MSNYYDVGDVVKVRTSTPFQDKDTGNTFDPDVVRFTVLSPDGTRTEYTSGDSEFTKEGTGDYSLLIRPDAAGVWRYAIEGETSGGTAQSAEEGRFEVRNSRART